MSRWPVLFLVLSWMLAPAVAEEPVDYLRQIKPVLAQRCYACHGVLKQKSDLRLDTGAFIRKGSKHGSVVETNAVEKSPLLERVTGQDKDERMPPEGEPLTTEQIGVLKRWITQGAPSPADEQPEPDPREHWAFRKPVRPPVPQIKNPKLRIENPIDAFLTVEREKRGLTPRPAASREVLLRRVYLDVIGLPPTREQLREFLADDAPGAYERVVDQLLNSPHYGERWGRHWMDIWRYSDWYGRRHVPDVWNSAPQIWRWRDWIIHSLNRDKGYDRMVSEMLAADEVAPGDEEAGVATGYLVRNWYALNPNQWMRENVEHTAKAFLGLTLNCAHCHDHKYDPISQKEYFQFRAFFEPIGLRQDWVPGEADPGPFQKYEYLTLRKVVTNGTVRVFDDKLDAKTFIYLGGDERALPEGKPTVEPAAPALLGGDRLKVESIELPPATSYPGLKDFVRKAEIEKRQKALDSARASMAAALKTLAATRENFTAMAATNSFEAAAKAFPAVLAAETAVRFDSNRLATAEAELISSQARLAADKARFKEAPGDTNALSLAASLEERKAAVRAEEEKLHQAGHALDLLQAEQTLAAARRKAEAADASNEKKETDKAAEAIKKATEKIAASKKAVEAAAEALQANITAYTPLSPVYPARSTGRRKALAEWMTSRDNPLTARVAVNHMWAGHFHSPLVASVFDFGRNGARPTHPELLDWLAVEFMESGWSMKKLHRLILTSAAYRQGSARGSHAVEASSQDLPSGQKGETTGETPAGARETLVLPEDIDPENHFLWHMNTGQMQSEVVRDSLLFVAGELDGRIGGSVLPNSEADKSRRRSLYFECFPEGGGTGEFVAQFDPPDPGECYRRTKTVVPQQALALNNSALSLNQSRILARRLWDNLPEKERAGAAGESAFIVAAFEQVLARRPSTDEVSAAEAFLKRQVELYRSKEIGKSNDAAPDKVTGPAMQPEPRSRESLVHALFSHNDFVTVR